MSPAGGGVGGGVALLRGWEFESRHNLQLRKKRSHVGRALPAAVNLMEIITQRHRAAKNKKEWNIKNKESLKVNWKEGNKEVDFEVFDIDEDG